MLSLFLWWSVVNYVMSDLHFQMLISKLTRPRGSSGKRKGGGPMLPEASTCDKHLYLPEYSSSEEVSNPCVN